MRLYDAELWAKYAGAVDDEQRHHRDDVNHSLVVPKRADPGTQLTSWMLLSDVGEDDGPTAIVPLPAGEDIPYWPTPRQHAGPLPGSGPRAVPLSDRSPDMAPPPRAAAGAEEPGMSAGT